MLLRIQCWRRSKSIAASASPLSARDSGFVHLPTPIASCDSCAYKFGVSHIPDSSSFFSTVALASQQHHHPTKPTMANTDDPGKLEAAQTHGTSSSNSEGNKHGSHLDFGPLAHVNTAETRLPPFGGEFQPGAYPAKFISERKVANPAPLGLCGFALTTFILGAINMKARGITEPNIFVGAAYAYGGLVQLLAGMWEMAIGNTFGATALSSYGGFWIAMGITFTPGGFDIQATLMKADADGSLGMFYDSLGLFLMVCTHLSSRYRTALTAIP